MPTDAALRDARTLLIDATFCTHPEHPETSDGQFCSTCLAAKYEEIWERAQEHISTNGTEYYTTPYTSEDDDA